MIQMPSDDFAKIFGNQVIAKVKSIIITTEVGDIVIAPCKNATLSLTTTQTIGPVACCPTKEATIETKYDNIIFIK